jgi:hypothetical protein
MQRAVLRIPWRDVSYVCVFSDALNVISGQQWEMVTTDREKDTQYGLETMRNAFRGSQLATWKSLGGWVRRFTMMALHKSA